MRYLFIPIFVSVQLLAGGLRAQVTVPYNANIRLNQIGFYPNCQKLGIVKDASAGPFYIALTDASDTLYTGTLSASANWSFSNENVRVADFSPFATPGNYILIVPGMGRSYPFAIANKVHVPVNKSSAKMYYFIRASTALTAAYAGVWARAAGHPDDQVVILPSAASAARPAGTVLPSPKGWYDAGDYNKYVVNSGISTYTLMAAYEHYASYYDTLNLNIPESGNGVPDILDQARWNLDWLLTMQDPADGGVYNKVTNAGFDGFIMPAAATNTRYFCAKGTAATFDFAAVMAVAYRVYKAFDPVFANQCLAAAKAAYTWGMNNSNVPFNNPGAQGGYPAVTTGGYGDNTFTDENEWAANELYIATLDNTYYANGFKNANTYGIPSWPVVRTLGLMSLLHNRKNLTALGFSDTTNMKNKLFGIVNPLRTTQQGSAYRVPIGSGGNADFVWGSNSQAANQGVLLLLAYKITGDQTYFNAGLSNLDYLNGRNATTYSFITGNGDHTPMFPHHRPSGADGIADPVPGMMVGGPNTDAQGDCGAGTYPTTTLRALSYQDAQCSYSTNEIAINWNAPYVYLSGAVEAINPCSIAPLPVTWLSVQAQRREGKVLVAWATSEEKNNARFIVQRSADGESFESIGEVAGVGTSDEIHVYSYTDIHAGGSVLYYRIVQIDLDGTQTFSQIVSLASSNSEVLVYPNPNNGEFTVEAGGILNGEITLEDVTGKTVFQEQLLKTEKLIKTFLLPQLPKGVYILTLTSEDARIVKRLVIQ